MKKLLIIFSILAISLNGVYAQADISTEVDNTTQIKIFPNPATNVVNILGLKNSTRADIKIWDAYGNLVLEHRWTIKNNALNIPITSLDSGIYSIIIQSKEQRVQTKFYKR